MTETFCKNSSISFSEYYFIISAIQKKWCLIRLQKCLWCFCFYSDLLEYQTHSIYLLNVLVNMKLWNGPFCLVDFSGYLIKCRRNFIQVRVVPYQNQVVNNNQVVKNSQGVNNNRTRLTISNINACVLNCRALHRHPAF